MLSVPEVLMGLVPGLTGREKQNKTRKRRRGLKREKNRRKKNFNMSHFSSLNSPPAFLFCVLHLLSFRAGLGFLPDAGR